MDDLLEMIIFNNKPFYITRCNYLYRLFYINSSNNHDIHRPVIEFKSYYDDIQFQILRDLIKNNYEILIILDYNDLVQWFQANYYYDYSRSYYSCLSDTNFKKITDGMKRK